MGTQQKKKKRTPDVQAVIAEIKQTQDLDANKLALQPVFEGLTYAPLGVGLTDYINVTTNIVVGTQTGT